MLKSISNDFTLNARQVLETLKGPFKIAGELPYQEVPLNSILPRQINCYTDGGVDFPTISWASIPGIGIWWPTSPEPAEPSEAGEAGEQPIQFLHERTTEKGLQQWTTLPGQMCSSTRAEIAAVGAALMKPVPIHIGIDNKGALSNAT